MIRFSRFIALMIPITLGLFLVGCGDDTVSSDDSGSSGGGTVIVDCVPNSATASWALDCPDGYGINGNGDAVLTGRDAGDYTLTWGDCDGWTAPDGDPETKTLLSNDSITFSGIYVAFPGTVIVDCAPDSLSATWVLGGPDDYTINGAGDSTLTDMDAGDYTISWGDHYGWTVPIANPETKTLLPNGSITFSGTYNLISYTGITETDVDGNILSIDEDDWTYDHLWVGEKLLMKRICLEHFCMAEGEPDTLSFNISNYSMEPVTIFGETAAVEHWMEPAMTTIPARSYLKLESIYTHAGVNEFSDILLIQSDPPEDSFSVPIIGRVVKKDIMDDQGTGFYPAFPNPADGSTAIVFATEASCEFSISIYKTGEVLVRKLIDAQETAAGEHEYFWDGLDDAGEPVPAGIYRARIQAGDFASQGDIQIIR